ncbi:ankyrin repeat domain-containing protein [Tamlana fucoidanivorans]|uniref:Ankyrin repeat domain-containing protein n=1 Tax=Allotamlana fucoidanivorans TaxID=2583814 RepID=A0A5C4SL33_9FLAO|nr:ankyrin repeat domain-containing protein [Tamlana fucoidanivorans]TNJ44630.1 ankyrin repeat domain-containing protein [Tamlana fucoidanivorans]
MKKTIIISAVALCFSLSTVNATSSPVASNDFKVEAFFKVNSFCVSIAKGDFETVKKLIDRGADINQKSNGMTPAMYAAKFNRVEILKLLIAEGANLKVRSEKKKTAADYAKLHGADEALIIIEEALAKKKNNC